MNYIMPVTQKGQFTVPKEFRDRLGLTKYSKLDVSFDEKKNEIRVKKTKTILDFAPIAEAPKGKNALKAREEMEGNYLKYDKKLLERI